jgi:hypothetical protein
MRTAIFLLLLSGLAFSQYPIGATAFTWTGVNQAGSFCWGFSCTPINTTVIRGETGTLFIRGDFQQPYVIGLSFSATRCLSMPTAYNMLVLDDPIFVVFTGATNTTSPILACPPGSDSLTITIPPSWPVGLIFTLQGLVALPTSPGAVGPSASFTQPITFLVQ